MVRLHLIIVATLALLCVNTFASPEIRLIQRSDDPKDRIWMTEQEILDLITKTKASGELGVGFMDVTDHQKQLTRSKSLRQRAFPTKPSQQSLIAGLSNRMSVSSLTSFLDGFSNGFNNRYYQSTSGYQSALWLRDTMQAIATRAARNDTKCELFYHSWQQPSVICTIEATGAFSSEVVICSAHSDSINSLSPINGRAPGADDDGSGVADFYEVFRVIVESGFRPARTLQFIGYAAEEVGLRGSQAIVSDYIQRGINVYGVYHNEMSGYPGRARSITILEDYVDTSMTTFLKSLVSVYTSLPYATARCGYGCSDHASWTNGGFSAVCTAEDGPNGEVNPNMHRAADTLDNIDMAFSLEFARLALATVIELSQFQG